MYLINLNEHSYRDFIFGNRLQHIIYHSLIGIALASYIVVKGIKMHKSMTNPNQTQKIGDKMNRTHQSQTMNHTGVGRENIARTPDFHGRHFSHHVHSEMDNFNDEAFIPSYKGIGPKGYIKSDESIKHDVCQALSDDKYIDASTIDVVVEDRVVKLSGSVVSRQEKFVIEELVENVPGVLSVDNHIRVNRDW